MPLADTRKRVGDLVHFVLSCGKRRVGIALILLTLGSATEGLSLLLLGPVLTLIGTEQHALTLTIPTALQPSLGAQLTIALWAILAALVVLLLANSVLGRTRTLFMSNWLWDVMNRLRVSLFEAMGQARWRFLAGQRRSDLHHLLTADIDRVQGILIHAIMFVQSAILLAAYGIVSAVLSPSMTALAVAVGTVAFAVLYPVRQKAYAIGHALTTQRQAQYATVSEFLSGLKVAKAFGAQLQFAEALRVALGGMKDSSQRFARLSSNATILFQALTGAAMALFVGAAVYGLALPLATTVALLFVFMRIAPRFAALQSELQQVLLNLPAFDAMKDMERRCRDNRPPVLSEPLSFETSLELRDVTFGYEPDADQVSGVSFAIPAGAVIAIVGPSGAGKSTLCDLVLGLLQPARGDILADGKKLTERNAIAWRALTAYVPQDVFILRDTVLANIRLGRPDANEAEVWAALEMASAKAFIEALPEQLETRIGDGALTLSGGERQRIALARALVRSPRLLVLDEATSALDWENQNAIAAAIQRMRGKIAVLTIAHRPAMIALADRVITLERGAIVEDGGCATLLDQSDSKLMRLFASEGMRARN